MPSVKNPNTVSHNRQIARAARARKQTRKSISTARLPTKVEKADVRRGARPGLLPTSGPNAPLSKKKARKLEKQMAHALRRKREEEERRAEVEMKDADAAKSKKQLKTERDAAMAALGKMDLS